MTSYKLRPDGCLTSQWSQWRAYRKRIVPRRLSLTPTASLSSKMGSSMAWGYRGGSSTAVQAWRPSGPCPLWEPSPSHPILL